MKSFLKLYYFLLAQVFIIFMGTQSFSQEKKDGIIISEIFFNESEPHANWIELYNPQIDTLVLERLRISHFRTINILPPLIRKMGGLVVMPDEYLILCADSTYFYSKFSNRIKIAMVPELALVGKGGFLVTVTKNLEDSDNDGFRYGDPRISVKAQEYLGDQVMEFSKDNYSYSRYLVKTGFEISFGDFQKSVPTPGDKNNFIKY